MEEIKFITTKQMTGLVSPPPSPTPAVDERTEHQKMIDELTAMLFGNALENGVGQIDWKDAPTLMAKLERAGLRVEGVMVSTDFGRHRPVIRVSMDIKVKDFPGR